MGSWWGNGRVRDWKGWVVCMLLLLKLPQKMENTTYGRDFTSINL